MRNLLVLLGLASTGIFGLICVWFIFMSIGTIINYFVFNFILSVFNFSFQLTWAQAFGVTLLIGFLRR
jgi:hypothetical protein